MQKKAFISERNWKLNFFGRSSSPSNLDKADSYSIPKGDKHCDNY